MAADVAVEKVSKLSKRALAELCSAASEAILDGAGFGWLRPPPAQSSVLSCCHVGGVGLDMEHAWIWSTSLQGGAWI